MRILKNVLLRESHLKFLEDIKTKKIQISALPTPTGWNLVVRCLKYTRTNLAKFIKIYWTECDITLINLADVAVQKHSFLRILDQILGPLIAFLRAAAKINYKDTLKVCRKITKITDSNVGFFLAMGWIRGWNSQWNFKNYWFKSTFIYRNCLLSIIIAEKNYSFLYNCMKNRCGPLCWRRLPFLKREGTLFSACLPIHFRFHSV